MQEPISTPSKLLGLGPHLQAMMTSSLSLSATPPLRNSLSQRRHELHLRSITSYTSLSLCSLIPALQLMENDVVVVVGPLPSRIAHVISHVVNELHVPLLSFGATDPTLSALQYPYFVRTTQNNYLQMYAIVDFVDYYKSTKVIAIYVDDDNGRNGVSVLGDAMSRKRAKISYKAVFPPGATESDISDLLNKVNLVESRVYVLHVNPDHGLAIFSIAKRLRMMDSGYV
ncbi:Glutamate receptor 3.5 [Glycine max]|nr:Glutamate receptor 3.5 [Glycine max]